MTPFISVIIITYNRQDKLRNLLESLTKQTFRDFEIIVVIDGSEDHTEMVIKEFEDHMPFLKYSSHENQGRSFSRNKGARMAVADLVLFLDDDMTLLPDSISQHYEHHRKYPGSICVGTQEEDPARIVNDFDLFRYEISNKWERNILQESGLIPERQTYLTAANFSIPRKIFMELRGFDKIMEVVEDFDLATRARQAGLKIYYNPKARALHDNVLSCHAFVLKQIQYVVSYRNLADHNPHLADKYDALAAYHPGRIKRAYFFLVSHTVAVRAIDRELFKFILPKKIRYRLYDSVITGLAKVFQKRIINF